MYSVQSYQVANTINIKAVKSSIKGFLIYSDSDELFFKLEEKKYLYIFQFGVCCFFNVDDQRIHKVLDKIAPHTRGKIEESLSEQFLVKVAKGVSSVNHDSVTITEFDDEKLRLIMLHTAQSVAMNRYSQLTESLLEEASEYTLSLERNGRLKISKTKLKKLIGKNLSLKNSISENLYIFEAPQSTWDCQELALLDRNLKASFDLKLRHRNVHERLDIIKENLDLFKDIWDHKESSTLEWIIIILILVEVLDLFIAKLF